MADKEQKAIRVWRRLGECHWIFITVLLGISALSAIGPRYGLQYLFLNLSCVLGVVCLLGSFVALSNLFLPDVSRKYHAGQAVLFLVLGLGCGLAIGALNPVREGRVCFRCSSQLKQIGLALAQYAADWDEELPPGEGVEGLRILVDLGALKDNRAFICSSTGTRFEDKKPLSEESCDYLYFGGGKLSERADEIIMQDKPGNHGNYPGNVLYGNGEVEWIAAPLLSTTDGDAGGD